MNDNVKRPVVILGAGRHGRNVADNFRWSGQTILGFLDDTRQPGTRVNDVPVLGGFNLSQDADLLQRAAMHVAIGNPMIRQKLTDDLIARDAVMASAIHPSAVISPFAQIGAGIYIAPFVRIATARIEAGGVIEPFCTIGGDSHIGAYVMFGAHCSLIAETRIGSRTFLGTHTSVIGGAVGRDCIVGAGSVVLHDLPDGVRAHGVPAKVIGQADWSRPPV